MDLCVKLEEEGGLLCIVDRGQVPFFETSVIIIIMVIFKRLSLKAVSALGDHEEGRETG